MRNGRRNAKSRTAGDEMAQFDYYSCDSCGCKTFYDVEVADQYETRVGKMIVICPECAKSKDITLVDKNSGRKLKTIWETK